MKIIDWEKQGNVVRFYLGADDCEDYGGDDFDDRPYECNAGKVYDEYIKGHRDIAFPFEYVVQEPKDDWTYGGNTPFCKDDMKARKVPCIVAKKVGDYWLDRDEALFSRLIGDDNAVKFYFGDKMEPSDKLEVWE